MTAARHTITVFNTHPRTRLARDVIAAIVRRVLRGEGVARGMVSVVLVDDATLRCMNREHLGHDYDTDVITFPIESDPVEGEIYISLDRAREQASEFRVGLYDEVLRLAAHGALHLAGYDDATPNLRQEMTRLEDHYLRRRRG